MELFVSALVALVVEGAKRYFGTNSWQTLFFLLAFSFCVSAVMFALKWAGMWDNFLTIVVGASQQPQQDVLARPGRWLRLHDMRQPRIPWGVHGPRQEAHH